MLDIKFVRNNPDLVKENIKKKFQDHKLELVDKAIEIDEKNRKLMQIGDELRMNRKNLSQEIGNLMRQSNKDEAEKIKEKVNPRKWVCVGVEKEDVIIKNKGDLIIVIIIEDETGRQSIDKAFGEL